MGTTVLGENIRNLRENENYSQKDLAHILHISPAGLSKYETGKTVPSMETLIQIADFFDVSVDYLLGRNTYKFSYDSLKCPYAKYPTVFDLLNDIESFDTNHKKYLANTIEYIKFHNDYSKLPAKKKQSY